MHGFQNDHTAWDPFVERLDLDRFRVTTFDLVGCGASGGAATWERCSIDEYAADLVAICDQLGLEAPIGIGHSLGGATVLQAALTWPHRLRALVLVAPASTSGLDFVPDDATFEVLAHPTPEQQRQLALAAFRHPPTDADLDALLAVIARATPEHIEGAARSMRGFERQGHLGALALPVLLACGDRDRHVPAAQPPRHPAGHPTLWSAGVDRRRPRAVRRGGRRLRRRRGPLPRRAQLTPSRPIARPLRKIVTGPLSLMTAIVVDGWS